MKSAYKISYVSPHSLASLPKSTPVLLAFSGGADSSALFDLLLKDSRSTGYCLYAAHFNHNIRGDEAERDAEFCRSMCKAAGVPFFLGSADVPELAKKHGNSIEQEAREQRYAFFEKVMRENDVPVLVTAHHAEDQIETVLLHVLRGSGINGLSGIKEHRLFADDLHIVRPILRAEKSEILSYCDENSISFVTDSTNSDTAYARNYIRSELTPKMRELQPNLSAVFARLSSSASEADDFITAEAKRFIEDECGEHIPLSKFNSLHSALKSKILSLTFEGTFDATLERVHIDSIIELAHNGEPHSAISLPQKTVAKIENGAIIFALDEETKANFSFNVPFCEGETQICNGVTIKIEKNPIGNKTASHPSIDVSCELISSNAHFRPRCEGDVIFAGKMNKKIKKLMSEKKVSLQERNKLPLLVSNNEILWIPSVAVCDRIKADKIKSGTDFFRIIVIIENN